MNSLTTMLIMMAMGIALAAAPRAMAEAGESLDLAAFGELSLWKDLDAEAKEVVSWEDVPRDARAVGVIWDDPRDLREVRWRAEGDTRPARIEYWYHVWPQEPPTMPVMEDRIDDRWRGQWLTAQATWRLDGATWVATFEPLNQDENPRADHLPGVDYRRTLKARIVFDQPVPVIHSLTMHSASTLEPMSVRIRLGLNETVTWSPKLEIFNGRVLSAVSPTPNVLEARLLASRPSPAGSNDMSVVTVRSTGRLDGRQTTRTFSFNTLDLADGPIYIPDMHAYVTDADNPVTFDAETYDNGRKIRDRIRNEPEQTFERASAEIPHQDPWHRQYGDFVELVLAADASWQKFAVGYDGNVRLGKRSVKARGAELKRLRWAGEHLRFGLGVGRQGYYREDCVGKMAIAEEILPVAINRYECEGLEYEQQSFATLLEGPLDPNDPERSEQTPAVLMVRLRAHNPGSEGKAAYFRLKIEPSEAVSVAGDRLLATLSGGQADESPILRAVVLAPDGARVETEGGVPVWRYDVPAGQAVDLELRLPYVSDINDAQADRIESLRWDEQRERVADYWRSLIDATCQFTTPEQEFNHLARSVVPHVHISTNKCPKSGLYMVPAASIGYEVYANEACFQAMMLDALGDTGRAGQYLDTFIALQGSRDFPGNYEPPQDGVYHGAKVSDEYDYTAHAYNLDHGTVLWALARHYSYTRDKAWLTERLPSMFKAVDWIERQRRLSRREDVHGRRVPEFGLLPAGHLEDNDDWGYWFSVNAYCVAGMTEMARALADIGHGRADEMKLRAKVYRDDLRAAVMRTVESAPVVRMRDGTYSPYVPPRARQRFRQFGPLQGRYYSRYGKPSDVLPCFRLSGTREVLYGPMILLDLEILDPGDVMAGWILDDWEDNLTLSGEREPFNVHGFTDEKLWFSQGGMVWQSNLQNPILAYLKRNETQAAIRNIYNNFAACLYRDVNALTEEYRMWAHGSGPFYKSPDESRFVNRLRDMLVLESGDDLWLASGTLRRWLASKEGIRVESINSYFGPVAFTLRAGEEPGVVIGRVEPPTRVRPANLWLYARLPGGKPIRSVTVNGRAHDDIDRARERIRLPADGPMDIVIRY